MYTKSASDEKEWGIYQMWLSHKQMAPPRPIIIAVSTRDRNQYLPVLQLMHGDLALSSTITIVIASVAGRTQTDEAWRGIANIMIGVGCVQVDRIAFSCALGFTFPTVFDMAKLASPACPFLALPCLRLPIQRVVLPPFSVHKSTPVGRGVSGEIQCVSRVLPLVGKCSAYVCQIKTECLLLHTCSALTIPFVLSDW